MLLLNARLGSIYSFNLLMHKSFPITNFILAAIATTTPMVIADQYFRIAGLPKGNARVMLLSGGRLDSSGTGIRHYTPMASMRHSAVYGDVLEYSYEFETDENGFRVTYNCNKSIHGTPVAITGDSFTEGQGSSSSWTEGIQKHFCDRGQDTINASIAGYGIEDMKDSLDYAYETLGARQAILGIINDDLYRARKKMVSNSTCSMYEAKERKCGYSATWWHHPEAFGPKEMIEFSNSKYSFGVAPLAKQLIQGLRLRLRNWKYRQYNASMVSRSIAALESIKSKYSPQNVRLVILPTKSDRNLPSPAQEKERRKRDLNLFLESAGKHVSIIDARSCPLGSQHFFHLDSHPNEKGHKLLSKCILEQI